MNIENHTASNIESRTAGPARPYRIRSIVPILQPLAVVRDLSSNVRLGRAALNPKLNVCARKSGRSGSASSEANAGGNGGFPFGFCRRGLPARRPCRSQRWHLISSRSSFPCSSPRAIDPRLLTSAGTRFLGSIWAFISNADEFTAWGNPGEHAEGCPPPDRYPLQEAAFWRRLAA